jgi:hypothetical protein
MARLGLLDTRTGLIIVYCSLVTPFTLWTMSNFFGTLPAELEEAARVDGCSRLGALFRVILPLSRPGSTACPPGQDRHNFPEVVASGPCHGHNFREPQLSGKL